MSLIPFILELADELHEFNRCLATGGMDVDDFGFGIYPHELQPQQQQQQPPHQQAQHPLSQQQQQAQQQHRRTRSLSQLYWLSNLSKSRHHPYYRSKTCCNKTPILLLHDAHGEKEATQNAGSPGTGSIGGTPAGDKETAANTNANNSSSTTTSPTGKSAYSVVNKNGFQVSMNVKQFAPNELTVKTIDNCIVVEGQHEDKEDGHGVISRHFIRKYMLPKGYDPNEVLSTLSSDGILTVRAPPPPMKTDETMERIVDIQQTAVKAQIQQSAVNKAGSAERGSQVNAASAVEQPAAAADTGTSAGPQQQNKQHQQLAATDESVQQQQPTTKDLQEANGRNGLNLPESNEAIDEQQTEPQTAEQADTSSNTNTATSNNNNNSVLNDEDSTTSKNNLKADENGEKEVSMAEDEEKEKVEIDIKNTKMPQKCNAETTSSTDAIMAAGDASAEPMETEEDEVVKNEEAEKDSATDAKPATDIEDAPMTDVDNIISDSNSVTKSINNSTNNNDDINVLESTNGIETTTSNDDVDIGELLTKTAAPEANDIVTSTNNGVATEAKTNITADGETTASLDTAEVTEMDTDVTDVGDVSDVVDTNGKTLDADDITVSVGIEAGIDVSAIDSGDGGGENGASVDDANDESISENNLMVAPQPPSSGDLVAAADAAIILAKTQCDVDVVAGAGDVTASKPAIATEEMAN